MKLRHWLHGLGSAFIGGGASAVSAWGGMSAAKQLHVDVPELNLNAIGIIFLSSAIFTAAAYLKQSPLPHEE